MQGRYHGQALEGLVSGACAVQGWYRVHALTVQYHTVTPSYTADTWLSRRSHCAYATQIKRTNQVLVDLAWMGISSFPFFR